MYRYVIAYKPFGTVSTRQRSPSGHPNLYDWGIPQGLNPAGRLDRDSEGLLLLTSDGPAVHRLTHPDFSHMKVYYALVLGHPGRDALAQLRDGVATKIGRTLPADVETLSSEPPLPPFHGGLPAADKTTWLRIGLREGKNRQIKRMTAAVGHPTLRLVRVAIGCIALTPDLAPGHWRDLTAVERQALLDELWPHGRPGRRRKAS